MTTRREVSASSGGDPPAKVREAALAELRAAGRARPWQAQARATVLVVAAMTLLGGLVVAFGGAGVGIPGARLPVMSLLLIAQGVALWAAIAPARTPRRSRLMLFAWFLVAAGAAAVAIDRGTTAGDGSPGWVCSVSHVGFGLAPLAAVLWSLREMADDRRRTLTAGLAIATVGLFWGEVACQRDVVHVLVHHVGAALVLIAACLLAARVLRRRTFAP